LRILIAEDDAELAQGLVACLRVEGYEVEAAGDGKAADEALKASAYGLLILDLALPRLDGFEVLRRLRARHTETLVMILSAEDEIDARIRGLDLGADDYLTKPFVLGELTARIRALLRRSEGPGRGGARCGQLVLDAAGQRIVMQGEPVELTRAEYTVLAMLIERAGRVVPKLQLFERLYEWESESGLSAIEVFISRIRRKIEGSDTRIRAIRGLGYLLEAQSGKGDKGDKGDKAGRPLRSGATRG
jgi:two-component system OmpR family response regulator